MTITIERMTEPTLELEVLVGELDGVLGANYEPHQRHGLAIGQLFEPHVRFFAARLDGHWSCCGGVALSTICRGLEAFLYDPSARASGWSLTIGFAAHRGCGPCRRKIRVAA